MLPGPVAGGVELRAAEDYRPWEPNIALGGRKVSGYLCDSRKLLEGTRLVRVRGSRRLTNGRQTWNSSLNWGS